MPSRRSLTSSTLALAGAVVLGLAGPSPAAAQAQADASCSAPSDSQAGATGQQRFAQTFTAQTTGRLTQAQISEVQKYGSPGDYVVSINSVDAAGVPTDTVLAAATIPNESVSPVVSRVTADFAAPVEVVAGEQYALVITRPESDSLSVLFSSVDVCPGRFFSSMNQTGAFSPVCVSPCDMMFAVFVEPRRAERALTLDANKGKVEKKKKVRLSGQLEASGNDAACEASQTVEIVRTGLKGGTPVPVITDQTDAQGNFATKLKVKKSSLYTARVGESSACESETSDTEKVRVQKPKAAKEA